MTPANALTIARFALAPVFLLLLLREEARSLWAASGVFALAAVTDTVDGWLARRSGTVTRIGRALDPVADKLLVALALLGLARLRVPGVAWWMVIVILGREVLVTVLRSWASRRGIAVPVSRLGKAKTTLQMGFAAVALAVLCVRALMDPRPASWLRPTEPLATLLGLALLATTAATVLSGLDYARKARAALARIGRGAA